MSSHDPGVRRILLCSKPLRPPLRDGSTVLVETLARALGDARPLAYFGDPARPLRPGDLVLDAPAMGHQPGLLDKARVLRALVDPRHRDLPLHLFFTPNRLTSSVVGALRRLWPRRPILQTLMSSHGVEAMAPLLRPLDRVIALSDDTARRLADAGVPSAKIRRIYPGVAINPGVAVDLGVAVDPGVDRTASISARTPFNGDFSPAPPDGRSTMIYAGDLDPKVADRLLWIAAALDRPALAGWTLTIACRPKGEDDAAQRRRLTEGLAPRIAAGQVELLGEVDDMPARLASASLQLFVADHVRRKVDLPLVLLEGLARGVGLCAAGFPPVREIFDRGRDHGLTPGVAVDPAAGAEGWAEAVAEAAAGATSGRWASAARDLCAREFSREAMARGYSALYAELDGAP